MDSAPSESARAAADVRHSDIEEFITRNMPLALAPSVPEIRLHMAHPASGLRRLSRRDGHGANAPPYWAYPWAGGAALARHFFARPETVFGRRVLDLGAGSGLVGIAAAKCGASKVIAAEIDPNALVAIGLNAAANGVAVEAIAADIASAEVPPVDLIAAGDVFYDRNLAERAADFFVRCLAKGVAILVGDVGRAYLPRAQLRLLAEYPVRDFGDSKSATWKSGGVFSYEPSGAQSAEREDLV
jgi:predicted nicotinamide N-methyase